MASTHFDILLLFKLHELYVYIHETTVFVHFDLLMHFYYGILFVMVVIQMVGNLLSKGNGISIISKCIPFQTLSAFSFVYFPAMVCMCHCKMSLHTGTRRTLKCLKGSGRMLTAYCKRKPQSSVYFDHIENRKIINAELRTQLGFSTLCTLQ